MLGRPTIYDAGPVLDIGVTPCARVGYDNFLPSVSLSEAGYEPC